jgi:TusA-related sulfurtransferase/nucleoside-triphosphatase THEP1
MGSLHLIRSAAGIFLEPVPGFGSDALERAEAFDPTRRDQMTADSIALDLRGLKCPLPALRTRRALRTLAPGTLVVASCTDPLAVIDIPHMVRQTGDVLERQERKDGEVTFYIRRAGAKAGMEVSMTKSLAALVFDQGEDVNRIVADFAEDLARRGVRLGGVIQISAEVESCECKDTHVLDLETGAHLAILQDLGKHSQSCRIDSSALAEIGQLILSAITRRPDLLFINRFGKLEAEGKGLYGGIGEAAASGIPTLVAVSRRYLEPWRQFTLGLDEEIACSAADLEAWWQRVGALQASAT